VERRALRRLVAQEDIELVLGPVAQRLDDDRSVARRTALDALEGWLDSDRHLALLASLDALADALPAGPRAGYAADQVIPRRARKAWRRLVDAVEGGADGPGDHDEALHEIRKDARRARYASEVGALVVGDPALRSARRAREVQDVLGRQHDSVVRRETLRRIGIQAHLDGENAFTYGRLHALAQEAGAAAERAARRPVRRAVRRKHRRWAR
jgi:CHAD domain-containing protein